MQIPKLKSSSTAAAAGSNTASAVTTTLPAPAVAAAPKALGIKLKLSRPSTSVAVDALPPGTDAVGLSAQLDSSKAMSTPTLPPVDPFASTVLPASSAAEAPRQQTALDTVTHAATSVTDTTPAAPVLKLRFKASSTAATDDRAPVIKTERQESTTLDLIDDEADGKNDVEDSFVVPAVVGYVAGPTHAVLPSSHGVSSSSAPAHSSAARTDAERLAAASFALFPQQLQDLILRPLPGYEEDAELIQVAEGNRNLTDRVLNRFFKSHEFMKWLAHYRGNSDVELACEDLMYIQKRFKMCFPRRTIERGKTIDRPISFE
jgi:hypothetical protein